MKTLFAPIAMLLLVSPVSFSGNEAIAKLYSLDGLPTFAKVGGDHVFDATAVILLAEQSINDGSWEKDARVGIETVEANGNTVLRVVQYRENHEKIIETLDAIRRRSPNLLTEKEEYLGKPN